MQELFDNAPCAYLVSMPNGRLTRVNQTLVDWTGRPREELLQSARFQELLTIPGRIFYENQFAPLLRLQGSVQGVAFDLMRQGRPPLPVLVSSIQRSTPDGTPTSVASILLDATDRRAYEQELQLRRLEAEQLAAVVTGSNDGIIVTSARGDVITWNAAAEKLFGVVARDIVGRSLSAILPDFDFTVMRTVPRQAAMTSALHIDMTALRADGTTVDVSIGANPHVGPLGELQSVSLIVRDVSDRRALERLQQEFLAMASHELRSPVASIKGYAQLMRRRGTYDAHALETIITTADQLDVLVGELMLAAQIQADRLDLVLVQCDLVTEARAAADEFSGQQLPVRFESAVDTLPVRADRQRLGQVFRNLISNAIKYSPEQSTVVVRVSCQGAAASVSVVDRGMGIPAEALPRLFERFFRVEASAGRVQGLGLGLFITKRLVEAHGGRLEVVSELASGSKFTVILPIDDNPIEPMSSL
jgi:PAS domain S-box-containing protein